MKWTVVCLTALTALGVGAFFVEQYWYTIGAGIAFAIVAASLFGSDDRREKNPGRPEDSP